jgi:AbrB family looped-hinge helix DNA binding protein
LEKTLGLAKILPKYQVTIPRDVRKAFDLKLGDRVLFLDVDGRLILRKA